MTKFIIKVAVFLVLCTAAMAMILSLADGSSDSHYVQFTSPRQKSLIIGSSRARFGVQPVILDSVLQKQWPEISIFNYAFTKDYSPFGPAYYESILRKLDNDSKDGVFVVTVEPWLLATYTPDKPDYFFEEKACVAKTHFVNMNPNFEYLIESFENRYWQILIGRGFSSRWFVHSNGWYETLAPMHPDSISARKKTRIKTYVNDNEATLSHTRVEYLEKTIGLLKEHGSVYLVRMPTCKEIVQDEKKRFPGFEKIMTDVSTEYKVPYIDLLSMADSIIFADGDHLGRSGGDRVTKEIGAQILQRGKN